MRGKFLAGAVVVLTLAGVGLTESKSASAATSVETEAVNWAIGKIGSTSYGQLCLKLVTDAYQTGASFNIESLTNFGSFNSSTYPQEVWDDGFKSGTTGGGNTTPPYGALVFFNASGPGASDPSVYSHVTIMASGGDMVSTNDVVDESAVHYETMAQVEAHHPYNTYVGWWLPDGTGGGSGGSPARSDVDGNGISDLILTTHQSVGSGSNVMLGTGNGFLPPTKWLNMPGEGWSGVTPLVGHENGATDYADYVFITNEGANGIKVFTAVSNGSNGFSAPVLKQAVPWMRYARIKANLN